MATLGSLITDISAKLLDANNQAVSTADVSSAINTSIRYYKNTGFWFNDNFTTITLTVDDPVVTLPSDFWTENSKTPLVINYSSSRYILKKVANGAYDSENQEGKGMPYIYTYRNGEILVYNYPDQAYSLQFNYLKDYDDFATDGTEDTTSNDFTTNAPDLIAYDALSRLHAEFRQDEKMEVYYSARAKDEKETLLKRNKKLNSTGTLTTEQI